MQFLKPALLLFAIACFAACQNKEKYPYAIRDFRPELRPYLTAITTSGVVGYDTASRFVRQHATDKELLRLSCSEIPVLRATALREIAERKGMDNFDVLMHHLDDTAVIAYDRGEWGTQFAMVTDDLIHSYRWKTIADKNKTIDEVITKHSYLRSAYTILYKIDTTPKYYPYIKQMIQRDMQFEDVEEALYALAKYQRKDDVIFIRQFLLNESNFYRMGSTSFTLMRNYPDTSYLDILEKYYPGHFYRHFGLFRNLESAQAYVEAISSYKSPESAEILTRMLIRKPILSAGVDTISFKDDIISSIRRDSCAAYSDLIKKIRPKIIEYDKNHGTVGLDITDQISVPPPKIRW